MAKNKEKLVQNLRENLMRRKNTVEAKRNEQEQQWQNQNNEEKNEH